MAWNLYDIFREDQVDGNGSVDLETPGGNGYKCALVTVTESPVQNTDDFWDDASANEVSGTNYTADGQLLANPAVTMSGAGLITWDTDDPATWAQNAGGFTDARLAIIIRSTGTDSTSELIAYSDNFAADRGNVSGDFSITLDAAGIFTSAR